MVVDADTVVSRNLLSAFAARFERGASAVQADYGVRNPHASWRTRMMAIALAAFHGVRSAARERLGLSCGLRGNGMAFTKALLHAHPPAAFSIVEDLEYGIQLGYAGIRVEYVPEARVLGQMAVIRERLAFAAAPLGARPAGARSRSMCRYCSSRRGAGATECFSIWRSI